MKKYLFGIFAIVLAIGFSAFTTKKVSTLEPQWFEYTNVLTPLLFGDTDPTALGEAKDQENYVVGNPECSADETRLCGIYAEEDLSNPGKPKIIGESIESDLEEYDAGNSFQNIQERDN